jgi:hypothetical protein
LRIAGQTLAPIPQPAIDLRGPRQKSSRKALSLPGLSTTRASLRKRQREICTRFLHGCE